MSLWHNKCVRADMAIAPYRFEQHDTLSQLCQGMIFFTLLCAVILKAGEESVWTGRWVSSSWS